MWRQTLSPPKVVYDPGFHVAESKDSSQSVNVILWKLLWPVFLPIIACFLLIFSRPSVSFSHRLHTYRYYLLYGFISKVWFSNSWICDFFIAKTNIWKLNLYFSSLLIWFLTLFIKLFVIILNPRYIQWPKFLCPMTKIP